jgi:hypothetical protein
MTAAPAKRKDTSEANAIWITEAWDNKARHDACLLPASALASSPRHLEGRDACRLNAARKRQRLPMCAHFDRLRRPPLLSSTDEMAVSCAEAIGFL